jgi:hypothetical protein
MAPKKAAKIGSENAETSKAVATTTTVKSATEAMVAAVAMVAITPGLMKTNHIAGIG